MDPATQDALLAYLCDGRRVFEKLLMPRSAYIMTDDARTH